MANEVGIIEVDYSKILLEMLEALDIRGKSYVERLIKDYGLKKTTTDKGTKRFETAIVPLPPGIRCSSQAALVLMLTTGYFPAGPEHLVAFATVFNGNYMPFKSLFGPDPKGYAEDGKWTLALFTIGDRWAFDMIHTKGNEYTPYYVHCLGVKEVTG